MEAEEVSDAEHDEPVTEMAVSAMVSMAASFAISRRVPRSPATLAPWHRISTIPGGGGLQRSRSYSTILHGPGSKLPCASGTSPLRPILVVVDGLTCISIIEEEKQAYSICIEST